MIERWHSINYMIGNNVKKAIFVGNIAIGEEQGEHNDKRNVL